MKSSFKVVALVPLLVVPAFGAFCCEYLTGMEVLPNVMFPLGFMFPVMAGCLVVALFAIIPKVNNLVRVGLAVGALVAQVFVFPLFPAGATAEMMGVAHRLNSQYSANQLRACAEQIRHKFHLGTLNQHAIPKDFPYYAPPQSVIVDSAELPASIKGQFKTVLVVPADDSNPERVVFALDSRQGIMCDDRKYVREFFVCSMAQGVHAYRYQRM